MEKANTDNEKCIEKNIEKSSKNGQKTSKKRKKYMNDQKMHKKSTWGTNFEARRRFWVDFWVPGEVKK